MRAWTSLALLFVLAGACAAQADANRAHVNYMLNCQGCHLPDGRGFPGKVPDMRGLLGRFAAVAGGREFLVRVPGAANAPVDDEQLAELMNWVIHEFAAAELPPGFAAYEAGEVGRLRRQPLTDVQTERQRLLMLIAADTAH